MKLDSGEMGVLRIDQPVRFGWSEGRRHDGARQFTGRSFTVIERRDTLFGVSAATTTRSLGGSSGSMWTKYSSIASDRCSDVYAMRTPGLHHRPPKRYAPSPSKGFLEKAGEESASTHPAVGDAAEHVLHGSRSRLGIDPFRTVRYRPKPGWDV
jgi:hypothetical protein